MESTSLVAFGVSHLYLKALGVLKLGKILLPCGKVLMGMKSSKEK